MTPVTFTVTTTADSGAGSLRDAVNHANTTAGADAITFAAGLGDVVLTTAELSLTDIGGPTTISGPSGGTQVVQRSFAGGTPNFRIFNVGTGATANFSGLTISNGKANGGGGISNDGTVTLTNSTLSGNTASGGGIFNGGTLTLNNTIIAGNFRGSTGTQGNLIGTGASPINPLLQPLASNGGPTRTHALGQNSPALGKASASVAGYSVYDQRGTARDLGAPDVGAYEVQHPLAPVGAPTTLATLFAPKPSATPNEAFVKGLYQATVLRAPDAGGLANWLTNLSNGMSRNTVAYGFVNSTENRTNQVTFFYRYFMTREPDTGGLNDWVGRLQSGQDEGTVITGFILSDEFSANNTNAQFVNLMYHALLGRAADTAGFNDWMTKLTGGGWTRDGVVTFFLRSEEGLNRVVRGMFQTYLKRPADTMTLETFRAYLNANHTFGKAAILMLGSDEFFNNATANMT